MTAPDAFTQVGVQLPLLLSGWAALGCFLVAGTAALNSWRRSRGARWHEPMDDFFLAIGGVGGLVVGLCAAALWVFMLVPFDTKYMHYYAVEGRVVDVTNVLSGDGDDGLVRQPVLVLDRVPDFPLVLDDPRAVELKGRDVALRCSIEWHYSAADTYSCRITDYGKAAS